MKYYKVKVKRNGKSVYSLHQTRLKKESFLRTLKTSAKKKSANVEYVKPVSQSEAFRIGSRLARNQSPYVRGKSKSFVIMVR